MKLFVKKNYITRNIDLFISNILFFDNTYEKKNVDKYTITRNNTIDIFQRLPFFGGDLRG